MVLKYNKKGLCMKLFITILNWIKGLFMGKTVIDADQADYVALDVAEVEVKWRKIIIDLSRFVLHLWHAPVVQKARAYAVWATRETFVQLPKGVISWVVPQKVVVTQIEIVGHLDVVHHGNPDDPIVRAELRLKHEHEERPATIQVKIKTVQSAKRSDSISYTAEQIEEELVRKDELRDHAKMCNLRWKMNCHENRKTMRRKEERRATNISYRNAAVRRLWAEEAHC